MIPPCHVEPWYDNDEESQTVSLLDKPESEPNPTLFDHTQHILGLFGRCTHPVNLPGCTETVDLPPVNMQTFCTSTEEP